MGEDGLGNQLQIQIVPGVLRSDIRGDRTATLGTEIRNNNAA